MTDSDGRSTFAALYLGLALVSWLLFYDAMEHGKGYAGAGIAGLFLLFTVIFGIAGMYKLLTISKGKSNYDDENNIEGEKSRNSNVEVQIWRNAMPGSDGRSIFGALYIGIALVSMYEFSISDSFAAPWCLLFAVFFGIAGMYKLAPNTRKVKLSNELEDNIEKEKDRNSNLEIRIFNNKKMLAKIFFTGLFIWILYLSSA